MPHSSRVGLDRQDILPVVRETEGLEGFKVHVQIVEKLKSLIGSIEGSLLFLLAFFYP